MELTIDRMIIKWSPVLNLWFTEKLHSTPNLRALVGLLDKAM